MIKHVVMWTIREGDTPRAKVERMAEVKAQLLGLRNEIDLIRHMEVHFNHPAAGNDNFDVVMISTFDSMADLDSYQNHPAHLKVVEFLRNVRQSRAAIDYTLMHDNS